jgi:hypothetical protein
MGQILGIVIPLAAGAAVSPAVLTLQLVTLSGASAPRGRSWAIAGGYALVLAGFGVLALLLAAGTGGSDTPSETEAAVKLAAAVVLAGLGVRILTRAPKPRPDVGTDGGAPRLGRYAAIGGVLMATNITTVVLFIPAIHDAGVADVDTADKALAMLIVFVITLIPAVGPPLAVTLLGERADAPLNRLNGFTTRHKRAINAGICFVFAAFLAAVSLPALI